MTPFFNNMGRKLWTQATMSQITLDSSTSAVFMETRCQGTFKYNFKVLPQFVKLGIFGPDGVFTQSMNQMNSVLSNINLQVNSNGNRRNVITFNAPNIQVN